MVISFAIAINIDLDTVLACAETAGQKVGARKVGRMNVITEIRNQEAAITVITEDMKPGHHFGTLLGSVRWSPSLNRFVVSLNDAIIDISVKAMIHSAFARGLGVDKKGLAVDTMPLPGVESITELPTEKAKKIGK